MAAPAYGPACFRSWPDLQNELIDLLSIAEQDTEEMNALIFNALQKDLRSIRQLAFALRRGEKTEETAEKVSGLETALQEYAALQGDRGAQFELWMRCKFFSPGRRHFWAEQIFHNNHEDILWEVAKSYRDIVEERATFERYRQRAAELGNSDAQFNLSEDFIAEYRVSGRQADLRLSYHWRVAAANNGSGEAAVCLAREILNGTYAWNTERNMAMHYAVLAADSPEHRIDINTWLQLENDDPA